MIDKRNDNYIKNENPYEVYTGEGKTISNDLISFYMQINQLKNLYRQGWIKARIGIEHINKCESVAEHSFLLALLAMSIIDKYKLEYDVNKCLKLSLVHELGEIYAGDFIPMQNISKEEKHRLEDEAIKKVLSVLNFDNSYYDLWLEFENVSSKEAEFIKELDGLEFILQGACYNLDVEYLTYSRNKIKTPILKEIVDELITLTKGKTMPKQKG